MLKKRLGKLKSKMKSVLMSILILFLIAPTVVALEKNFSKMREDMVQSQIEWRGVTDEGVLNAMRKVERHKFVSPEMTKYAYEDEPLPIGYGQTISQPYIVALMTEALQIKKSDKVLEIGTGSGYQAAILAEIAKEVYTIEIVPELAKSAAKKLEELGYKNIHVKCADGFLGWPKAAPFDAIIVTCSANDVPPPLIEQLGQGGRLIMPMGLETTYQNLVLIEKKQGRLLKTIVAPVRFVPMTGITEEKNKR